MAKQYGYIDQGGAQKTFDANNAEEALANRPSDADPKSGVILQTINETDPVVSSEDNAQQFGEDSKNVTDMEKGVAMANENKSKEQTLFGEGDTNKDTGKIETTGDPVLDQMNKENAKREREAEREEKRKIKEYQNLYDTTLRAIDATVDATIGDLNSTYAQRITEQKRINELNIARVKAYGLGSGGIYTPVSFGDAVTNREQEASDKIKSLNNERNSLIAKARALADQGRSDALRQNMDDIRQVENEIRAKLKETKAEADAQYKLLRDYRKEEEEKHKEKLKEMSTRLASIAPKFYDEYSKLGEAEKDKYIKKISQQYGLDYDTVYGTLESSGLDLQKKKAEIESEKALAYQRYSAGNKDKNSTKAEEEMRGALPSSFAMKDGKVDPNDAEKKRKEYIKKWGTDGKKYWDEVFKDDTDIYNYENYNTDGGDVANRAESAGYDYKAMREAGLSDETIDAELRKKGY